MGSFSLLQEFKILFEIRFKTFRRKKNTKKTSKSQRKSLYMLQKLVMLNLGYLVTTQCMKSINQLRDTPE